MHILSVDQFEQSWLEQLFNRADELREMDHDKKGRQDLAALHVGKQLCSLFYEPSTRTRLSFETAAVKLGMGVVSTENAREFSSAAKGETIEDTVKVLNEYHYDAIVLRHHETGAARQAADVSRSPIINAGDGKGEHPTQALLDMYTIYRKFGRLDNLTVIMGGDLANGRTVRSLSKLLSRGKGNLLIFVSIPELQIGADIKEVLTANKTEFREVSNLEEVAALADVVYWTRLQKERLDPGVKITHNFVIDGAVLPLLKQDMIIMHPLPRVDEITTEVDDDPRAQYFEQAGNGLYVRMALIDALVTT